MKGRVSVRTAGFDLCGEDSIIIAAQCSEIDRVCSAMRISKSLSGLGGHEFVPLIG